MKMINYCNLMVSAEYVEKLSADVNLAHFHPQKKSPSFCQLSTVLAVRYPIIQLQDNQELN